jgi:hypothetical protein
MATALSLPYDCNIRVHYTAAFRPLVLECYVHFTMCACGIVAFLKNMRNVPWSAPFCYTFTFCDVREAGVAVSYMVG